MTTPHFKYPTCAQCQRPVDSISVKSNLDGSYRVEVYCHDKSASATIPKNGYSETAAIRFTNVFADS